MTPFRAESNIQELFIDANGTRTRCFEAGSGPTIVLLHGAALAVDAYNTWFRTLDALAKYFRVITFDQVGFGETDMPANGAYKNRLERVDHARDVLHALKIERAVLVGHSEGGFMAARLAIVEPTMAASLVIVTSGGTAPYLGEDRDEEWIKVAEANYNNPSLFKDEESFITISRGLCHRIHPDYEQLLRASYRRAAETGHRALFMNMPKEDHNYRARERLQREYVLPQLKTLDIPILLIWALNDLGVVFERGIKLLEYTKRGELCVYNNAAHNIMHDRAKDFNDSLRDWCLRHH